MFISVGALIVILLLFLVFRAMSGRRVVGVVGALAAALFWSGFSPYDRRRSAVVRERDVV
jgi:hypothetical protein